MNGKGDTSRPISVDQEEFDANWDTIFGGKGAKHTRETEIIEISKHVSDNGRRSASVIRTPEGYSVELFEQSRYIRTITIDSRARAAVSLGQYAEDVAEEYVLGYNPY